MKRHLNWLLVVAIFLGLGACKKQEAVKTPEVPVAAEPVVAAPVPTPEVPVAPPVVEGPKVDVEVRAGKLGFAKHLLPDTEALISVYEGSKVASRVKTSRLWKLIQEELGVGLGMDDEDEVEGIVDPETEEGESEVADLLAGEDEPMGPAALFESEFTIAMGKTTGAQIGNLLTLNRRMTYFQMRGLAQTFASAVKAGDMDDFAESMVDAYSAGFYEEVMKDPESGIKLLEAVRMPPIYAAFRTKAEDRDAAVQQLSGPISFLVLSFGKMAEPTEVEVSGQKFQGFKIVGSEISASLSENREMMAEMLDEESIGQLLEIIAKKNVVILTGAIGDYAVLFIGESIDDLKFAPDFKESLVASEALAFSDGYASKDLTFLSYGEKEATDVMMDAAGGISEMTNGLRDGFAGADGIGEMRDLNALFQMVAERESALRRLASNQASGMVAFFEDGIKIESHGGYNYGALDLKSPNQLASLGNSEDVVLFANMTGDAVFNEKASEYYEALLEMVFSIAMKVVEAPIEDESLDQYREMAKMFDSEFRPSLLAMWDALSDDFSGSLGGESAWVVDLKGAAPAVPGVPQVVAEGMKVPRFSMIRPVKDRAKLAGSWEKMNTTLTGMLAKVGKMAGTEFPMQKPMSTEKNDYTTWFFPLPFFNDDFLPSVTVGDKWFAASTSKVQALDLISKADEAGAARDGFWLSLNFKTLATYAEETAAFVEKNAESIMGEPVPEEDMEIIKKSIELLGDLDKMTVHSRREGETLRSSIHFKTR